MSKNNWAIKSLNGRILWTSNDDTNLTPIELSTILNSDMNDEEIQYIVAQVIRNASYKSIGFLLTCISCNTWRNDDNIIDPMKINTLKNAQPKTICGKVFRKGDIVWSCRSCAKDLTCVQCDDCFRNSNHHNHEVYFHRESEKEGGCCDCGDPSAWSKSGNCTKHNHEIDPNLDPSCIIPSELMKFFKPVLIAISGMLASYVTCITRGYQKLDENEFLSNFVSVNQDDKLVIRLHNDDIHTYDEVTNALQAAGLQQDQAKNFTLLVDKAGEAAVSTIEGKKDADARKWNKIYEELSVKAGLLFSIIPESIYIMGPKITSVITWLQTVGNMNDGLRRLISNCLIINMNELPDCVNAYPSMATFNPKNLFSEASKNKFPNVIQHLAMPSEDDFLKLNEYPFELALHPFKTCHKNCLSLMIAASPYLGKSVKKALNDIVLIYQHDKIFKSSYSQSLTALYPSLYFLLSKSVGTMENTIFNTSVQVYTCKTIVCTMSSDGIGQRVLRDTPVNEGGTEVHITKILSSTLRNSFNTIAFLAREENAHHPYHLRLRNYGSALHQACRDFEYCVEDPVDAVRILSGHRDPGVVDDLLEVYASLNCVERFKRRGIRDVHVERDSEKWQDYWKIIGEMDSISTKLVNSAFFTQIPKHNVSETLILQAESEYDIHINEALHQVVSKTLQSLDEWTKTFELPLDEQYFRSKTETCNYLGHPILFRPYQRYQVSVSPVSIHIPLHRFLTKILTFASYGGVDLTTSLKVFSEYPGAADSLADYPLRCLSFVAQVNSDMWRKNGSATASIAYFYQMNPYVRLYRDIDINAIQIAMAVSGPDSNLALALDRFEVLSLLEATDYNNVVDPIKGHKGSLLAHLLRTLIHIVTQPLYTLERVRQNSIDPFDVEGIESSIKREVCHFLLGGARSISNFAKMRGLVGSDTTITDDLINSALDELCIKREMGDDRISLEPKDCVFELFDPEFSHLSHKQSQAALENVKAYRKKLIDLKKSNGKEDNDIYPIVSPATIKKPHPELLSVRSFLYRPFTFTVLERCMSLTLESMKTPSSASLSSSGNFCAIISKIVHLITLQIHCYPDFKRELCRGTSSHTSEKYFNRSSGKGISVAAQESTEIERNIEIEKKFVLTLADVFLSGIARTEDIYESGLKWILREFSTYNEAVRDLLLVKNINFKSSLDEAMEKRKNSAKERLSAKMKRQADSFSKMIENMSDDDDDDDDEMQEDNDEVKELIPTCIVCHTSTSEHVGYLSFVQASSVLQQTLTLNDDYQNQIMNSIYRVVALRGCDILKSNDDNATVKHHLQQGEHVLVSSQVGKWVKVLAPVPGWIAMYCNLKTNDGASENDVTVVAQLYPVKDLQFNRFGRNKAHVSSCGHCMHRSCWETYHAITLSNVWNTNFGTLAIDAEKGELLCPLCKGITNSFLPVTPIASIRESIAASDITTLSTKLSSSYNWSQIGEEIVIMPTIHSISTNNDGKRFIDDCLSLSIPPWIEGNEKIEYTAIDEITKNQKVNNMRCTHAGWTATAYTIMSATCNGRWIDSKQGDFLKSDSIDNTMITQLILCMRKSSDWFDSLNDFNDFVLNPLQRLLSGSLSSILIENFSSEESIASLKGFHLIDASSCTVQDCYSTLLRLPSYTVPHASLVPDLRRLSYMLALFHKKGVQDKYLWNFLHLPLLSHDLQVIAVAVTSYTPSLQSLEEGVGLLVLARLIQILLEPASTGFIAVDKNLKRERSDVPKTASMTSESKLLIDLKVHVCSLCKIPIAATAHEDELTEHILKLWLHYLEYSCVISFVASKIFEPKKQFREKYYNALNSSDTMIVRVNRILGAFGLPPFHELLSSNGMFELATKWSQQFLSTCPQSLDSQMVQEMNPIIPSPIQVASKLEVGSTNNTNNMDIDQITIPSSFISSSRPNDDDIIMYNGLNENEHDGEDDEDEDEEEIGADIDDDEIIIGDNDEAMVGGNMQALFQSILGGLQQANAYASIGNGGSSKWKLIGVFPTNRLVDEPIPGMLKLPNPNDSQTLASFHSTTPLLGSISGTHVINGINGERLEHVFPDVSHMAISINHRGGLIKLPSLYTDLYQMAKFPEGSNGIIIDDPAVCLICGHICSAGNRKSQENTRMNLDPGEATLHARECGSGVGVFFLAHKGTVLLLRGSRAIYYPSVYVDQNGESGEGLHSNKPLFLNAKKYRKLEELYLKHQIGTEVTRKRSTAEKNIRLNWY